MTQRTVAEGMAFCRSVQKFLFIRSEKIASVVETFVIHFRCDTGKTAENATYETMEISKSNAIGRA